MDYWSVLHYHWEPISDHTVDIHVEEHGIYQPPWVGPRVTQNWGPWCQLCLVTTYCFSQNSTRIPHSFGPAPYPSSIFRRLLQSKVSYAFLRSSNNSKKGFWYIISSSWDILRSTIAAPVPRRVRKPCEASWNSTSILTQVLMTALVNFHRTLNRPIPWVSAFTFVRKNKILYISYVGRLLWYHMCCTSITSFSQWGRLG